jgi:hypothetical protein
LNEILKSSSFKKQLLRWHLLAKHIYCIWETEISQLQCLSEELILEGRRFEKDEKIADEWIAKACSTTS